MEGYGTDVLLLSNLLKPQRGDESEDEEEIERIRTGNNYLSPGDISAKNDQQKREIEKQIEDEKKKQKEELAALFDETENSEHHSINNWKQSPTWDISYRQQVTASDVFLQMGAKNPSTASCENMIIKIQLPGESKANIDVKVLEVSLEVNSPKFYLNIPLPHPVDPQLGNAQYDSDNGILNLTLVMKREFDYINF